MLQHIPSPGPFLTQVREDPLSQPERLVAWQVREHRGCRRGKRPWSPAERPSGRSGQQAQQKTTMIQNGTVAAVIVVALPTGAPPLRRRALRTIALLATAGTACESASQGQLASVGAGSSAQDRCPRMGTIIDQTPIAPERRLCRHTDPLECLTLKSTPSTKCIFGVTHCMVTQAIENAKCGIEHRKARENEMEKQGTLVCIVLLIVLAFFLRHWTRSQK